MLFSLFIGLGVCLTGIETLQENDLSSPERFLVFLYYKRPGFNCPACASFMSKLHKVELPVRTLNFAENVALGSRFLQYKFPSLIVRDNRQSYVVDTTELTVEEAIDAVNSMDLDNMKKVRSFLEVDSRLVRIFAFLNPYIFSVINVMYYVMDYTPEYVVNSFFIMVIAYLVYSIVEILSEPDAKVKAS